MKTYYLVKGGQQTGPYSIEELATFSLTQTDMLWTEGMAEWKPLSEISELQSLLKKTPPPIPDSLLNQESLEKREVEQNSIPHTKNENEEKVEASDKKKSKNNKNIWWIVALGIICVVSLFLLFTKLRADATKAKIEEETERIEKENHQNALEQSRREQRISELVNELEILEYQLDENTLLIEEANKFKLFRLRSEKAQELKMLRDERNALLSRAANLQSELEALKSKNKVVKPRSKRRHEEVVIVDTLPYEVGALE